MQDVAKNGERQLISDKDKHANEMETERKQHALRPPEQIENVSASEMNRGK